MRILLWNIQDGGVLSLNHPDRSNLQNILTVIRDLVPDLTVLPEYETEYRRIFLDEGLIPLGYTCAVCEDAPDATLRKRTLLAAKRPFTTLPRPMEILRYSWRNWIEAAFPESGLRLLGIHVPLAQTSGRFGDSRDNCRETPLFRGTAAPLHRIRRSFLPRPDPRGLQPLPRRCLWGDAQRFLHRFNGADQRRTHLEQTEARLPLCKRSFPLPGDLRLRAAENTLLRPRLSLFGCRPVKTTKPPLPEVKEAGVIYKSRSGERDYAFAAFSLDAIWDFRLAAWFLWMIPLEADWSMTL